MSITALHVIPEFGTGGVELAAEGLAAAPPEGIEFRTFYLASLDLKPGLRRTLRIAGQVARLLLGPKPRVMIFSLWRCALLLPLFRLAAPRARLALFLHSDRDAHGVDRFATRLAAAFAHEIWTDAEANVRRRLPRLAAPARIISYRFPLAPAAASQPRPRFAFWGRLHHDKDLPRAIDLFARVHALRPAARFLIIGPDRGARGAVERAVARQGLASAIDLQGEQPIAEIARRVAGCSFFVLTSRLEGACTAVIEAMQLGLVPVTVAVGEVANYCRDGENTVMIGDDPEATARALCALLDDPARYAALQRAGIDYWRGRPSYAESMAEAIRAAAGQSATIRAVG